MVHAFGQVAWKVSLACLLFPVLAEAADKQAARQMTPEEQAWENVLQENLGSFYLPLYKKAKQEGRETAWDYVEDDPSLPRVLLIGDSISRGYTIPVRRGLAGKANVHRAPENCGSTKRGLETLDVWLGDGNWDVIHFNFGIHDRNSPPAEYEERLDAIVERLKETGAKLIWATSTPISPDTPNVKAGSSAKSNEIAQKVMKRHDIPINDLYGYIKPTLAEHQLPKNCHFSQDGYEHLGKKVVEATLDRLDDNHSQRPNK
jgi:hypothetical protein